MPDSTPKPSLLTRLCSLEGALLLAGLALLLYGLGNGATIALFWGGMILAGQVALHFVRKKDWQAHWAELEAQQRRQRPEPPSEDHPRR